MITPQQHLGDIADLKDITSLVEQFYKRVMDDDLIGHIFRDLPGFSLEKHIPVLVSFWDTLLFGKANYKGNPMQKHIALHQQMPLQKQHFQRWLQLWESTIAQYYSGVNAEVALTKARHIAQMMQHKIGAFDSGGI